MSELFIAQRGSYCQRLRSYRGSKILRPPTTDLRPQTIIPQPSAQSPKPTAMPHPFLPLNGAAILFALIATVVADERPPNLIYIMCDDLGYGDLGCFGQETIQTPRIDALAREGMRLTCYYAGCTVCRPSRLVLWTGQHTGHTPVSSNAQYVFRPEDVTVAELLQDAGYATGGVGKWAMGGVGAPGHPNRQGFDFWFGFLNQSEAHNHYPTHLFKNEEKVRLKGNVLSQDPRARLRVSTQRVTYAHDVITEEALGFIRRHADRPFLLHVHWTVPHANNEGGTVTGDGMEVPDYGIYAHEDWPTTAKGQAAMITRMDGDVGRIVDLVRQLQIEGHTLIIFTSDNGPHSEGGHRHEYFDANGPLRGFKRDLYDGGIRSPTIAWWPGRIQPGTLSDRPSAFWDWMPTACELAGVNVPEHTDGISLVPTMLGEQQADHEYLYWQFKDKIAVRSGNWKLVRPGAQSPYELYDLDADIGEMNNRATDHPDIVDRLRRFSEAAIQPR